MASKLGIRITGTIGIIVKAKLNGFIPSIQPLIEKIRQTDFRLPEEVLRQAYIEAKELIE